MERTLGILMEGLIDYAGLFPPASLGMDAAARAYAGYRESPEAAWLGRFVLPAGRLPEFARSLSALGDGAAKAPAWRLSALLGPDPAGDLAAIAAFHRDMPAGAARVDSVELKADSPDAVRAALAALPRDPARSADVAGVAAYDAYVEIPLGVDPAPLLAAVAAAGGRAKVRTGGVTPSAIPPAAPVARFLAACARAGVPFKATAGLHHPVRSLRRLTSEPDGPEAVMHGFLNVFLAAAFARQGLDEASLAALLEETDPAAFAFDGGGAGWRGRRLAAAELAASRRDFALAFGSCSFEEPRADLKEMRLA
jgi:hypothetical protein